jgi:hypothetical protein
VPDDERQAFHDFDRAIVKAIRQASRDMARRPAHDEVRVLVHHRTFAELFSNPFAKGTMEPDGQGGWTWRGFVFTGTDDIARDHVKAVLHIEHFEGVDLRA